MLRTTVNALTVVINQPSSIIKEAEADANPGQEATASIPRVRMLVDDGSSPC